MTARILVADGVATTRITLKVRLNAVCYDVAAVSGMDQILQQVDAARPSLIILGDGFADRSATEICSALSADRRLAGIPILMLVRPEGRVAALKAGATATLEPDAGDHMLMARVRGMLRDAETPQDAQFGMAEALAAFVHVAQPKIVLVADNAGRAIRWRQLLSERMACRFEICDPDEALGATTAGRPPDLYLIAADIRGQGDGLRLLSELRSRHGSRDAAFVIAVGPDRGELAAMALDLGASDVLPETLGGDTGAQAAAMSLQMLLSRKTKIDQRRAEVQRHMVWAMTDPLTGLFNRRYAMPKLTEIARDAMLAHHGFAVFAIDLDYFKAVNDTHGHSAGDAVLAEIAQRLRDVIGSGGLAARLGGEEFLGVLQDCTPLEAMQTAEALRQAIQARPVMLPGLSGGGLVHVTASIGVATVSPMNEDWPEQIARLALERADRALLSAKAAGRNRVIRAEQDKAA